MQFPKADALIVKFDIILVEFAIGLPQILVAEEVVAAASGRDGARWVIAVQQLRGLLELFEDVDLGGHLLRAPVGLPARLYQRLFVQEDWTQLVTGLVLHFMQVSQAVKQLLEVLLSPWDAL